ncbi:LOW QUALITY PROTEIN: nucleolar pre-ribosomal-associated protein 1 [Sceloporus undulatus]|uniref:LOW QUALITY PROTEIN: nucleolar pre-ribosomal-associated protein 1 n=1 Tax=Sceloporus undulatus TaxID=8520 RepID=UPI001C4B7178|nr:LOW QUALITY PROTEIN: nucleolar pre-ribosomal-associated protein 1 [Sceloporus undulatus]
MGAKRKSMASAKAQPSSAKRPRGPAAEELTGARLKALLRDPSAAMEGLETFISSAKSLPSEEQYDVVEGYIKVSVECAEILKLLDGERRPESEMLLIFQALQMILLRTASDLAHFHVVGMNIVKKLINSYMRLIYAALYSEGHRMSRLCLTLLSAMVTQGPDAARDVYAHFDFNNKFLPSLVKKRDYKGKPDVRMAYIQYALSFLIAGDNTILVQVLELKDFIPDIFRSGLKEDRISTVSLLLSTLASKVVQNKNITKTQKVRFFTADVLNHIATLYRWNGITDVETEDVKASQDPEEAGKVLVRELVHNFLMDLCCSLKHGINFYDPSLGTSGRGGNLVLLRFLLSLKTAVEDEMVADLMVNIFKVCPDLLNRYFKESQYSFVPRLKSAWMDNMKLLRKIYEAQPEISNAFKTTEFIPLPRLLSMVMVTTIPAVCNKAMFTQGLNIASKTVKHTIFLLISVVLKRALENIKYCLNENTWEKSEIYTPSIMQEFVQQYREALSKLLPDMTNIIAVWQSLLKQAKEHGQKGTVEDATSIMEEMAEVKETNGEHGSDDAETTLLKAVLLHVICLYQQVVPHLVAQSNFDFSKLIKGIITEKGLCQEIPPVLQHNILMVALELPANKFTWFKMQDEAEKVCGERSVFYLLLKMFVTSNHSQLKASTKKLIIKVLHDSGVFEYTWKELELWLEHLDDTIESKKEAVIQFLEKILVKLVTNPYPYTDKAADLVQEASILQANLFTIKDVDNVSIPISHIDDVLDMIDVLVEGNEGLNEEIGPSLNEDMIVSTFPFSAIVPASLEARNKLLLEGDENMRGESMVEYLITVFTDLLHSQRDPLALCLMFQLYDKDLHSVCPQLFEFSHYYNLWIPQQAKEALQGKSVCVDEALSSDSSFSSLLKNTYQKGVTILLEEDIIEKLNEAISQLQSHQLLLASKHVLLYLKTTVENFSSFDKKTGLSLLNVFVELLKNLLHKGDDAEFCNQQKQKHDQTESDLFVDAEFLKAAETGNDKILEELLSVVFRHPTLENWFLAVEKRSVPPHNLSPVKVKLLSAQLNCCILELLKMGCSQLQPRNQLDVLSKYFSTITKTVLDELHTVSKEGCKMYLKRSQQMEALHELHTYMDTQQLKEVVLAMLQLPKESLVKKKAETVSEKEKYLSRYGETLIHLLMESYQRGSLKEDQFLSREHIQGMSLLLTTAATEELEKVFMYVIQKEPAFAQAVGVDVLLFCLNHSTETSLAIVALLIQYCQTHLLQFELWCLKHGTGKRLKKNMGLFLALISTYLGCREQHCFTRLSKVSSAVTTVLRDALWPELLHIVLNTTSSSETFTVECPVLSKLLPSSETDSFINLVEELPVILEKGRIHEYWTIADAVSRTLESSVEKLNSWRKHLLSACIKWLIVAYSSNKTHETHSELEISMLSRLEKLLNSVTEVAPEDWHNFVKMGLKHRYKDQSFLKTFNVAINLLYQKETSLSQRLVKLSVLYIMITQHSLFLSTMLKSREDNDTNVHSREALVDILLTLVKCCPAVCESSHFPVLLGAYGATLSVLDQKILLLLKLYEKNGISLVNFRILLWGPAAVEHHKTCKSLGKSLWQQPSMEEIMCLLDRDMMMRTILHFPQHRHLLALEEEPELLSKGKTEVALKDLYDPCFLLQLFSELLRPECVVACHKFVDVNAFGLAVAALSSYDCNMRAAAYYVLNAFHSHLEGARFREQKQLLYLMDVVQNGISQPNLRFTFPLALYISRVAQQMLKPEEHMYTKLNKFLLSHQFLDLKKVPGFFHLFYSFDLEHKMEREWVLAIIREGLRDKHCYELYDHQRIFHVILSFFHSPLCDEATQHQILEILQNAAYITKAAYQLIRDHSLLTWILSVLEKRFLENKVLNHVISLVHNLWVTNLGDKRKSLGVPCKKQLQANQKFLPLQFISEFLHILITLLKHIRVNLDFPNLIQFFSTLSSVLEYRILVIEAFREMGRFTVNEHVLSNKDVLLLLHKWSIISKDVELQNDLQIIAQQYQTKDLLKNIKEKNKPEMPFRTLSQLAQKKNLIETETASEWKQLHLEECKSVLRSILVQWKPVFLDMSVKYPKEQNSYSNPTLSCKIAYLVFRWLVKSHIDSILNVQNVLLTFKWLKKNVLQNSTVVEEILKDEMLRSDIFKIYNSIWSATEDNIVELSDLSLLNDTMLHLLDFQDLNTKDFHGIVRKFCLSSMAEEDTMKKAAGMFLTSVYIGDIWLGAKQPDMFINHIKLVCGATDRKQNNDQEMWKCEEPVVSLCKDLYSLLIFTTLFSPSHCICCAV